MKILFQGDTITDTGRGRNITVPNRELGGGYVNLIASHITCDNPKIEVFNRGISGTGLPMHSLDGLRTR